MHNRSASCLKPKLILVFYGFLNSLWVSLQVKLVFLMILYLFIGLEVSFMVCNGVMTHPQQNYPPPPKKKAVTPPPVPKFFNPPPQSSNFQASPSLQSFYYPVQLETNDVKLMHKLLIQHNCQQQQKERNLKKYKNVTLHLLTFRLNSWMFQIWERYKLLQLISPINTDHAVFIWRGKPVLFFSKKLSG